MMKTTLFLFAVILVSFVIITPCFAQTQFQTERISSQTQDLLIQGDVLWQITSGQLFKRDALTGEILQTYRSPVDDSGFSAGALAPDGALWLSLQFGGVARFDGVGQWQVWNHLNTPVLPENRQYEAIGVDADGAVWVYLHFETNDTYQSYRYQNAVWERDTGLSELLVRKFLRGPQGEFLAYSLDSLMIRSNNTWTGVPRPTSSFNTPAIPVFDPQGRLWLTQDPSITKFYRYNSLDQLPDSITQISAPVNDVVFKTDGTLFAVTTGKGLARWDGDTWQYLPSIAGNDDLSVGLKITRNSADELWIAHSRQTCSFCLTLFAGLAPVENHYGGIPEDLVLGPDGTGNMWYSGYGRVLTRENATDGSLDYFELFDSMKTTFNPSQTKLIPGTGDDLWLFSTNEIMLFDGNTWSSIWASQSTYDVALDAAITSDGKLFMSYFSYGPDSLTYELRFYDPATTLWDKVDFSGFGPTPQIGNVEADGLGNIWFYGNTGVGKRSSNGTLEIFPGPVFGSLTNGNLQANTNGDIYVVENTFFNTAGTLFRIGLTGTITPVAWPEPTIENVHINYFKWHLDPEGRIWILAGSASDTTAAEPASWLYEAGIWTDMSAFVSNSDNTIGSNGLGTVYFGDDNFLTRFKTAGRIEGSVYWDRDNNCTVTAADSTFPGILVVAENGSQQFFAMSRADGGYRIYSASNTVIANVIPPNPLWESCTTGGVPLSIADPALPVVQDFELRPVVDCPFMQVTLSTPFLRRCFNNNYTVEACNTGPATATDAYVALSLPAEMTFLGASLPETLLNPQLYRVDLGDMVSGACKTFTFNVLVECDNTRIGQTLCITASVFPDSLCDTGNGWNGADLRVNGVCAGDSVRFDLKNVGTAALSQATHYQLLRNDETTGSGFLNLNAGQDSTFLLPANGDTWRLVVDQEPTRLYPDIRPSLAVEEACPSPNQSFTTGFVTSYPNSDGSVFSTCDCHQLIGAVDPNDKSAQPRGVGEQTHFILPRTEINYQIRFQNTGTDTAFTVVIRDTLDAGLDYATFKPGVGSQPYRIELTGNVISFIFENILLPDSNINEAASHGFVQFSLRPRADLTLGSAIFNRAGIYFDFNEVVLTNTVWHIVDSTLEQVVGTNVEPAKDAANLAVFPNPAQTYFWVKRPEESGLLSVFDQQGRLMTRVQLTQVLQQMDCGTWPNGLYILYLRNEKGRGEYGKLVVEH